MTHLFHSDRWLSGWKRTSFKKSCRQWWKAAGEGRLQITEKVFSPPLQSDRDCRGCCEGRWGKKIKSSKQGAKTQTLKLNSVRRAGGADEYSDGETSHHCQTKFSYYIRSDVQISWRSGDQLVMFRWSAGDVQVISRWSAGDVQVISRWCSGDQQVMFR